MLCGNVCVVVTNNEYMYVVSDKRNAFLILCEVSYIF